MARCSKHVPAIIKPGVEFLPRIVSRDAELICTTAYLSGSTDLVNACATLHSAIFSLKIYSLVGNIKVILRSISCNTSEMV